MVWEFEYVRPPDAGVAIVGHRHSRPARGLALHAGARVGQGTTTDSSRSLTWANGKALSPVEE